MVNDVIVAVIKPDIKVNNGSRCNADGVKWELQEFQQELKEDGK